MMLVFRPGIYIKLHIITSLVRESPCDSRDLGLINIEHVTVLICVHTLSNVYYQMKSLEGLSRVSVFSSQMPRCFSRM